MPSALITVRIEDSGEFAVSNSRWMAGLRSLS